MALWFSKFIYWLFSKFSPRYRELSFNRGKLNEELENLSNHLYEYRNEFSYKIMREVIELVKNIETININIDGDRKRQLIRNGRIRALTDLGNYIDLAVAARKEELKSGKTKQVRDSVRVQAIRTSQNKAEAAI